MDFEEFIIILFKVIKNETIKMFNPIIRLMTEPIIITNICEANRIHYGTKLSFKDWLKFIEFEKTTNHRKYSCFCMCNFAKL